MTAASQNARLRAVLSDGNWHSSRDLIRAVPSVLHSRVAEMRRQGYRIEHKGGGAGAANHFYRWDRSAPEETPGARVAA